MQHLRHSAALDWTAEARGKLAALRRNDGAWGYRGGAAAHAEPTAMAVLALHGERTGDGAALASARRWLAAMQQEDGSVGLSPGLEHATWATSLAALAYSTDVAFRSARDRAGQWLLATEGVTIEPKAEYQLGHDPSIPGWSWAENTAPWLEPTAMSLIALQRAGLSEHRRVADGCRMIVDRAIPGSGWNYGNNLVFGTALRPQPGPTGLALLALAAAAPPDSESVKTVCNDACDYLERALPNIRAAQSLCWATLGLRAWRRRPAAADGWLAQSYAMVERRGEPVTQLAYLLLAARADALASLGVSTQSEPDPGA